MKKFWIFALVLALTACEFGPSEPTCEYKPDQKERQRIFQECLHALPAGPVTTKYNDWNEVVDSCEDAAYHQSLVEVCK